MAPARNPISAAAAKASIIFFLLFILPLCLSISQAVAGVTLGTYGATDASGWTVFTPSGTPQYGYNTGPPASGNTMVIYVANGGSDAASSTEGSAANPYATIAKGLSRIRQGEPDWLLLAKGSTWNESAQLKTSGKSANEPQIVGAYDPSGDTTIVDPPTGAARPILKIDSITGDGLLGAGGGGGGAGFNYVAIVGLDIYAYARDPNNPSYSASQASDSNPVHGINNSNHFDWILIEDTRTRFAYQNMGFDASSLYYTYNFTISLANVTSGAVYSDGSGNLFEAINTASSATTISFERLGQSTNPALSGTLTKISGTGDATISYSAWTNPGFSSGLTIRRSQLLNSYSISTNGGDGMHMTAIKNVLLEENVFDHDGWAFIANSPVTFTVSAANATVGAVYSNANRNFTVTSTITGGTTLATTAADGWPVNNTSGAGTLTKVSGTGDATISFSAFSSTAQITIPGQYRFNHNYYLSQFVDEYDVPATYIDANTDRGNINSRNASDDQARRGATVSNSLFTHSPHVQNGALSNDYAMDNCVIIESQDNAGIGESFGISSGSAPHYDRGNSTITNNIIAHGRNTWEAMGAPIEVDNSHSGQVNNNILFDWSSSQSIVLGGIGAIIDFGTITGGSGGSANFTFTGFIDDGSGNGSPSGKAGDVLTVTSITGTPLAVNQKFTSPSLPNGFYIQALGTGTGGTGTYLVYMNRRNTSGGYTGSTPVGPETMTLAKYYVPLSTVTGIGSGASAYITVSGGAVTNVELFPDDAFIGWTPGSGYVASDKLTATVAGVTGFSVLVGSVRNTTTSGNKIDLSGTNTFNFPDPGRTIERYDAEVLGGPGTFDHFILAATDNYKGNWDSRLTAKAVNDWIRAGFGIFAVGGSRSWIGRF